MLTGLPVGASVNPALPLFAIDSDTLIKHRPTPAATVTLLHVATTQFYGAYCQELAIEVVDYSTEVDLSTRAENVLVLRQWGNNG